MFSCQAVHFMRAACDRSDSDRGVEWQGVWKQSANESYLRTFMSGEEQAIG